MRIKIGKKILEIVKKEEAAAKKMIEEATLQEIKPKKPPTMIGK